MYNIHQHNSMRRMHQHQHDSEQKYAQYLVKHADFKQQATEKQKHKLESFLQEQQQTHEPFYFEDDHHKVWRPLKQFRDVEDNHKFIAFKTFRHKPHYEMDKYFNERERKQISELSMRKQPLVRANIIPEEQRNRSQRSQGPLNPKISFRERRKDEEYLQPRLRFSNVTDRQRMNETAMSYDDKFASLYKSYELTKSKLGRTIITPSRKRYEKPKGTLDYCDETYSESGKVNNKSFFYEREIPDAPQQPEESPPLTDSGKFSPDGSRRSSTGDRSRTYFKLAKTVQLMSKDVAQKQTIERLLKDSQFERRKDLTNIVHNRNGENFCKSPIL